jgi:hypothetical protein
MRTTQFTATFVAWFTAMALVAIVELAVAGFGDPALVKLVSLLAYPIAAVTIGLNWPKQLVEKKGESRIAAAFFGATYIGFRGHKASELPWMLFAIAGGVLTPASVYSMVLATGQEFPAWIWLFSVGFGAAVEVVGLWLFYMLGKLIGKLLSIFRNKQPEQELALAQGQAREKDPDEF